ncbi:MAG: hypothetical protein EBS66_16405 [Betaproteobacteria bacterium]|nr:hypothetical protein [Betaproteobacteria bacterium]
MQDAVRAREDSGCHDLMIGRGMVTNPGLGLALKKFDRNTNAYGDQESQTQLTWQDMLPHLMYFWELVQKRILRKHQAGRFKQWLNFLRKQHGEAQIAFLELRTIGDPEQISLWFQSQIGVTNYDKRNYWCQSTSATIATSANCFSLEMN